MDTPLPLDAHCSRREALKCLGWGGLILPGVLAHGATSRPGRSRPHLMVRFEPRDGLLTVDTVRQSIASGLHKSIWEQILERCDAEAAAPVLTARSETPGRHLASARKNNPDYTICRAVGQRILRHALALLITEDKKYKAAALTQLRALFDESVWPAWIDQAHLRFGLPADLRTGMLSQDTGLAFDWLYPFLDTAERAEVVEGIDRRGIRPFLASVEQDAWWLHDLNNWYSVIIGGLGIAGMALAGEHPEAERLIGLSLEKMRVYLSIYGPEGEFNESIAYSNATRIPVAYFHAYWCHIGGGENPLARPPFPQTAEWTMYLTLPPGRYAVFGDGWVGQPPQVEFMAAIAAATKNPVYQDFVQRHLKVSANPYVLLWLDGTLHTRSPQGVLPLGRVYHDNGAHVVSRTDWGAEQATMVVYGKAKRDHNHAHNDLGQVCIDGFGQRLIVDLGSPSSYPPDFFDEARYKYYNASVRGHNVLMFDGREQRYPPHDRGVKDSIDWYSMNGVYTGQGFWPERGGYWQVDLTRAYDGARMVRRTVVHLFPGLAVVYDEADLDHEQEISLRWHTIVEPQLADDGRFQFQAGQASLAAWVMSVGEEEPAYRVRRHKYRPPYDRDRDGDFLEQRHEPYVETVLHAGRCRLLSVFALTTPDDVGPNWTRQDGSHAISTRLGKYSVSIENGRLAAANLHAKTSIEVAL